MGYKYDLCISFHKKDRDSYLKFYKKLEAKGLKIFNFEDGESLSWGININQEMQDSKYFVFLLTPHANDSEWSKREMELAMTESSKRGLDIILVGLEEIFKKQLSVVNVFDDAEWKKWESQAGKRLKGIAVGTVDHATQQIFDIILEEEKVNKLYKEADQAWIYGAYEQAYNNYLALTHLVKGDAVLNCYERAANCCEKAGKWEEAKKLYHLSKNEQALRRLKSVSNSNEISAKEDVNQELLHKIANYCDASIDLFYELLKNNQSPEGLNCLKTSYSRLLNYCKTIGGMDDVIASALSKMRDTETELGKINSPTDEAKIDIVKSYRTYLGLEFPESDNYDVFISYKSEDEMLARRVYDYLLSEGKRVFFACEVLPDMGKTEYRDAIMDALDHSQHFVLVTSKLDYITSNWVKEEWSFYVSKLIEDNHKGNIAIVIHDDFKVDKNQLPPNLRYKQRLLMSNFKESLLKYLQQ